MTRTIDQLLEPDGWRIDELKLGALCTKVRKRPGRISLRIETMNIYSRNLGRKADRMGLVEVPIPDRNDIAEDGRVTVRLDGLGAFVADFREESSCMRIEQSDTEESELWAEVPAVKSIGRDWIAVCLGGRACEMRFESLPIFARALAIRDAQKPTMGAVHPSLDQYGVHGYPLTYWPILLPLIWRDRLPQGIHDPRCVIGHRDVGMEDRDLMIRAAITSLCILGTQLLSALNPGFST